jgi:hypothetical protein
VTIAVGLLLGPPLGRVLFAPSADSLAGFWAWAAPLVRPEATEHARYVLSLLAPLLVVAAIASFARRPLAVTPRASELFARCGEALLLATVAIAIVAQHRHVYAGVFAETGFTRTYFTLPTLIAAAAIAVLLAAALTRLDRARLTGWARETPARRSVGLVLATLFAVAWVITALNSEGSIGNAHPGVFDNIPFWLDETFAVLDGRAPLATFHAQYAHLWPYLGGATMSLFGASYGVYAATMASVTLLALLGVYALLRRVVGSSLFALALFLPFVAHGFFMETGSLANRYGPSTAWSMFPMRYAGPFLLAWLTARHLDGARPGRLLLSIAGGLVLFNNLEFGLPAVAASFAAILWAEASPTRAGVARLLVQMAGGILAAAALVCGLTLIVAGTLPRPSLLVEFAHVYGVDGFGMLPMPALGLHLAVYLTFAAALVVATVRAVAGARGRPLTGMLAWSAVFGFGAGAYFVGRSHPDVLIDLFSAWALALVLLVAAVARAVLARPVRRLTAAELAVLFGLGVAVCSIAQTATPWSQVRRLDETTSVAAFVPTRTERFVAAHTHPGEHVLLIARLGHRIAYDVQVDDVMPYADTLSIPRRSQLDESIRVARREGVQNVFFEFDRITREQRDHLLTQGYRFERRDPRARVGQLVVGSSGPPG